ncbi:unnamed protein product, partial [Sphagnum troendelagicum]
MLELYKMPRKELQALCKQHSLPANKTNLAMADALSACLSSSSSSSTRRKATAKSQFLGVTKTTIMKARGEKKSDIPETSLASLILSGTLKSSSSSSIARRSTEKPSSTHSSSSGDRVLGFPQPNTTPLRRGLRKTDRQLYSIPEEKCHKTEVKAIKPEQKNWVEVERPSSSPMRLEVENLDVYKELLGGGRLHVGSIAYSTQSVTQTASECEEPLKLELDETQQQLKMDTSVPQDFDVKTASPTTQFEDAKRISPLSRIQLQLDATIAKATGILSKYAEWKAESAAHTKIPGDSSQPEVAI